MKFFYCLQGMAAKQYSKRGGSVSLSMLSVVLLQGIYVWDALYNEKAILTTMDITTDGYNILNIIHFELYGISSCDLK